MGQFLQTPDPSTKLVRQYGIRGLFSPDLVPSLQPVVLIDDLTGGISNEPQRIATAFIDVVGVAAEFTVVRFEVPPNVIAQITQLMLVPESTQRMIVGFGSSVAAPASLATSVYSDGRLRSNGQIPAGILGGDTYAAQMTGFSYFLPGNGSASTSVPRDVSWVIGRTDGSFDFLEIACANADQNLGVAIQWREFDAMAVR